MFRLLPCFIISSLLLAGHAVFAGVDSRGSQFIGLREFSKFQQTSGERPGELVLTSPEINSVISWNELVISWNADSNTCVKIEARGIFPEHATKYYTLGLWAADSSKHPRQSVRNQNDDDAQVQTDTLVMKRPCNKVQLRVTLSSADNEWPFQLTFLGLSFLDTNAKPPELSPNRAAWGKTIPVPERSQLAYPGGEVWCSPTSTSMLLTYWAKKLDRPALDHDVPEVVKGVFDPNWPGTGNWPFNTAFAGSQPGMRAYVTRLSDVSELEDWIANGIPVGVSVCYNRLRGRTGPPSGHLVVCVGFTKEGDVIVNDPGTSQQVRRTFSRKNLIDAWANSRNTVYLIYPTTAKVPKDRFKHWDSPK